MNDKLKLVLKHSRYTKQPILNLKFGHDMIVVAYLREDQADRLSKLTRLEVEDQRDA